MKRIILLFFFLSNFCLTLLAQHRIQGEIYTTDTLPLKDANIVLTSQDSVSRGTISDEGGRFVLKSVKKGDYTLSISCVGCQRFFIRLSGVKDDVDLGKIVLLPETTDLKEVTVSSVNRIRSIDRQIFYPTTSQLKYSTNGLTLLHQINIGRLLVDLVNNTVTSIEGNVLLCIDGRTVSAPEILALRPEEILRVEYHERPGLRYSGAAAVVDYITRERTSGGVIAADLTDAPFVNGQNVLVTKLNHEKSEFGVIYDFSFSDMDVSWEKQIDYHFPDRIMERLEKSEEKEMANLRHNVIVNYNKREQETYYFNATLNGDIYRVPEWNEKYSTSTVGEPSVMSVTSQGHNYGFSPSLDLYFERFLKRNRTLVFNVVGSYFNTDNENNSKYWLNDKLENHLQADNKGEKYSLIGQIYHEKYWESMQLAFGVKHQWSDVNNDYRGDYTGRVSLTQNITDGLIQIMGRTGKFDWVLLAGVGYYNTKQQELKESFLTYKAILNLKYQLNERSYLLWCGTVMQDNPSLGSLNDVVQSVDDLLKKRGNFGLKSNNSYQSSISYALGSEWMEWSIEGEYVYKHKPVSAMTYYDNGYFFQTELNQGSWQQTMWYFNSKCNILQNHLMVSLSPVYAYTVSRGEDYTRRHSTFSYHANVTGMYKNWMCVLQLIKPFEVLTGEILNYGTNNDSFMVMHNYNYLSLSVGISNFLGREYKGRQVRDYNALVPKMEWTSGIRNQVFFKLSYALPFGRQYESSQQKIQNKDQDAGIFK